MITSSHHKTELLPSPFLVQRPQKNGPRATCLESATSSNAQTHDGTLYHDDKIQSLQSSRKQESDDYVSSSKWRARYRASRQKLKLASYLERNQHYGPAEHSTTRSNNSCETNHTTEVSSSSSSADSKNHRALLRETRAQRAERKIHTEMSCGRVLPAFEHTFHVRRRRPAEKALKDRLHASLSQLEDLPEMEGSERYTSRCFHNSMPDIERILEGAANSDNDDVDPSSSSEQLTHRQMMDVQDVLNDEHTLVFLMSEEIQRLDKERTETITSRHLMEISEEFGIPIAYTAGRGLELVPKKLSEIKAIAAFIQHHTGKNELYT